MRLLKADHSFPFVWLVAEMPLFARQELPH